MLEICKLLNCFQIVLSWTDIKLTTLLYSIVPTLHILSLNILCVVCKNKSPEQKYNAIQITSFKNKLDMK